MSRDKTERISVDEYRKLMQNPVATNKYHNTRVEYDGHQFDSRVECSRYCILKAAQEAGYIANLRVHPRYVLTDACEVDGIRQRAVEYEPDFEYEHEGVTITEDVKGYITAGAKQKIKQFQERYRRRVRIVMEAREHVGKEKS